MNKVLVVPDVHLKPWMVERAERRAGKEEYAQVVFLGDVADDWGKERDVGLYEQTYNAVIHLAKAYPKKTYFCYGNHDLSYRWRASESGYSVYAEKLVERKLEELEDSCLPGHCAYVHRIGNVLFSHAGLVDGFVDEYDLRGIEIDELIGIVNYMDKPQMWRDNSPIWARPQSSIMTPYPPGMAQVMGHTPVPGPYKKENTITLDTFSTYSDGTKIGPNTFFWVDTDSETIKTGEVP